MQYNGKTVTDVVEDWFCRLRARALSRPAYIPGPDDPETQQPPGPTEPDGAWGSEEMVSEVFENRNKI